MGGSVIKTKVPVIEARDFEMFLMDHTLVDFEIYINPRNLYLVIIFPKIDDAVVYTIKDLEVAYNENKPYYFEPDSEFEKELEKKYGSYSECNEYYIRKYDGSIS